MVIAVPVVGECTRQTACAVDRDRDLTVCRFVECLCKFTAAGRPVDAPSSAGLHNGYHDLIGDLFILNVNQGHYGNVCALLEKQLEHANALPNRLRHVEKHRVWRNCLWPHKRVRIDVETKYGDAAVSRPRVF